MARTLQIPAFMVESFEWSWKGRDITGLHINFKNKAEGEAKLCFCASSSHYFQSLPPSLDPRPPELLTQPSRTNVFNQCFKLPSTISFQPCIPWLHFTFLPTSKHSCFKFVQTLSESPQLDSDYISPKQKAAASFPALIFSTVWIQACTESHISSKQQKLCKTFEFPIHSCCQSVSTFIPRKPVLKKTYFLFIVIWQTTVYWAPEWIKLSDRQLGQRPKLSFTAQQTLVESIKPKRRFFGVQGESISINVFLK